MIINKTRTSQPLINDSLRHYVTIGRKGAFKQAPLNVKKCCFCENKAHRIKIHHQMNVQIVKIQ